MQKQSLDGIRKNKIILRKKPIPKPVLFFDGVRAIKRQASSEPKIKTQHGPIRAITEKPVKPKPILGNRRLYYRKLQIVAAAFMVALAFTGGMWTALNTHESVAVEPVVSTSISKGQPIV